MPNNEDIRSESPAEPGAEPRACEDESGPQNGSDADDGDSPEDEFERLWGRLSDNQKKVAQEYLFTPTKAEAAREVGLSPSTVYEWPDHVWEAASRLVDERKDGLSDGLSSLSPQALDVLRRALDPDGSVSRVESEAAQYLINQLEGKPTRKQEIEHSGGIDLGEDEEEALDDALSHLDED